jgi:hypothetical protein
MNNPYAVHFWSRLYYEEALREARTRHLERRLREARKARSGQGPVGLALANVLSLVRGA